MKFDAYLILLRPVDQINIKYLKMDNQRFEPFVRNKKELKREFITCNYANKEERDRIFPHLVEVNTSKASLTENALAFVIRSNNDDDIHKVL
jgi:hypothetical protein